MSKIGKAYLIQFEDEESETSHLHDEVFTAKELAEDYLWQTGYEKKLNWNNKTYYESSDGQNYADILEKILIGKE